MNMVGKKPLKQFRVGSLSVALWENDNVLLGKKRWSLKASLTKTYKDRDGAWRNTSSLGRNDVALAIPLLQKALDVMIVEEGCRKDDLREQETLIVEEEYVRDEPPAEAARFEGG